MILGLKILHIKENEDGTTTLPVAVQPNPLDATPQSTHHAGGQAMSRLCRLRNASHGDDGQWAYSEIVALREQVKKLTKERDEYKSGFEAAASKYRNLKLQMQEIINVC